MSIIQSQLQSFLYQLRNQMVAFNTMLWENESIMAKEAPMEVPPWQYKWLQQTEHQLSRLSKAQV